MNSLEYGIIIKGSPPSSDVTVCASAMSDFDGNAFNVVLSGNSKDVTCDATNGSFDICNLFESKACPIAGGDSCVVHY